MLCGILNSKDHNLKQLHDLHDKLIKNLIFYYENLNDVEHWKDLANTERIELIDNLFKVQNDSNLFFRFKVNQVDEVNSLDNTKLLHIKLTLNEYTKYYNFTNQELIELKNIGEKIPYDSVNKVYFDYLDAPSLNFNNIIRNTEFLIYYTENDFFVLSGQCYLSNFYPIFISDIKEYLKIRFFTEQIKRIENVSTNEYIVHTEKGVFKVLDFKSKCEIYRLP